MSELDMGELDHDSARRKAADYLLRALQQSQSHDIDAVRRLIGLAEAELEKSPGKKQFAG